MKVRVFLTAEEFIEWVNSAFPKDPTDSRTDEEYAVWAICLREAAALGDCSTKELAELFLNGVESYKNNPVLKIQEWLDTAYSELEDVVDGDEAQIVNGYITQEVQDMYCVPDVVELVTQDFSK